MRSNRAYRRKCRFLSTGLPVAYLNACPTHSTQYSAFKVHHCPFYTSSLSSLIFCQHLIILFFIQMCKCGVKFSIGERRMVFLFLFHIYFILPIIFKLISIPHSRIGALLLPILRAYLPLAYYLEYILLIAKPSVLHCYHGEKSNFLIQAFSLIYKELRYISTVSYNSLLCIFWYNLLFVLRT